MDELRYQVDLLNAMNERLQADERMYRLVCATSRSAILYIDLNKGSCRTLANWEDFFAGIQIHNVSDISKLYSFIDEKSVLSFRELLYPEHLEKTDATSVFKLSDGKTYLEVSVSVTFDENENPSDKIIRFKDVTKAHSQNDELMYMAYYDANTGLINRNYFVSRLSDFVSLAKESNAVVSVMFIDIDGFHSLNDGMGMVAGDEIVQTFGQMLRDYECDDVIVSHFNADIYCVAIYDPKGNETVDYIYNDLKERCRLPLRLTTNDEVLISFTVGVAEYPEACESALELINCAEIVMFKAKKKGKGLIMYFDAPILNEFLNTINIENKLKEAVFEHNFMMNFQPQFYSSSGTLRGVEALIRWRDNDGNMISPGIFIPIAEKNGTIIPIGNFVIKESIRNYVEWVRKYNTDMYLSINISAVQYKSENFVETILDAIAEYEADPEKIELEITESFLIDDFKDVKDKLEILREYGIRISLDDFGTGYSSLSYLKGLPIDTLKIDKSFVDTINFDSDARIILDTIIYMSKKLGLETVAEGVETKDQLDYLTNLGVDCIQGFLLGKPMDPEGIEHILLKEVY